MRDTTVLWFFVKCGILLVFLMWLDSICHAAKPSRAWTEPKFKRGQCIKINIPKFDSFVCTYNIYKILEQHQGEGDTNCPYEVQSYYKDVRNGCPVYSTVAEEDVVKVVDCKDF